MGFRFRPVDDELISYLIKFVSGNPVDSPHIRVLDLYGNKKPSDIFHDLSPDGESTDVNYLFTPLKKKSAQGDQPMPIVGYCLEYDQNYDHIEYSSSCVPISCNLEDGYYCGYNEFELREVDEQEFERAKDSVPSLEESLSKLSNILLQGSDDNDQSYLNLLRGLVPPITDDQSSQELLDLMSSADYGVELPHHDFELLEVEEQEFERVKASVPLLEERLSELSNSLLQGSDN
ncbi:hypothetical protein HAX54_000217 [Datura stramonium]|uniref:NAC domain-containing protein n=1 Tax=Datura stramonium TaxID=4076 RepID=A0ABS8WSE3_DATST|nr:hypothetical protein [Datura stramonium]